MKTRQEKTILHPDTTQTKDIDNIREWIDPSDPNHTMHRGYRINSKVTYQSHVYIAKWNTDRNDVPIDYPCVDNGLSWRRLTSRIPQIETNLSGMNHVRLSTTGHGQTMVG